MGDENLPSSWFWFFCLWLVLCVEKNPLGKRIFPFPGKGKDDICLPFVSFFVFGNSAFTVLPDLCGCEIFNRFPFSDSHEDIDYSSYSLSLSLSHSATSLTQFLFRDFCFF